MRSGQACLDSSRGIAAASFVTVLDKRESKVIGRRAHLTVMLQRTMSLVRR
jgi:hypothetical protein